MPGRSFFPCADSPASDLSHNRYVSGHTVIVLGPAILKHGSLGLAPTRYISVDDELLSPTTAADAPSPVADAAVGAAAGVAAGAAPATAAIAAAAATGVVGAAPTAAAPTAAGTTTDAALRIVLPPPARMTPVPAAKPPTSEI